MSEMQCHVRGFILFRFLFANIVTIFAGTGICGIACMLTDNPLLQVCFFTVLQAGGVGSVALNTVTVELYPTKLR